MWTGAGGALCFCEQEHGTHVHRCVVSAALRYRGWLSTRDTDFTAYRAQNIHCPALSRRSLLSPGLEQDWKARLVAGCSSRGFSFLAFFSKSSLVLVLWLLEGQESRPLLCWVSAPRAPVLAWRGPSSDLRDGNYPSGPILIALKALPRVLA